MAFLVVAGFCALVVVGLGYIFFNPSYDEAKKQMKKSTLTTTSKQYEYKDTLVPVLKDSQVSHEELFDRGYGPVLMIVKVLIGVIPNCDNYLEIWPAAFRTYNLMVPNFFNVPVSTLGLGVASEMSLSMYVASRAAECAYCSAHTCSFALRRGTRMESVKRAMETDKALEDLSEAQEDEKERSVVTVSKGLARVPCDLSKADLAKFKSLFSADDAEKIVCGAIGMGFLNKVMDAIGVELETSTFAETSDVMGVEFSLGKAGHDIGKQQGSPKNPPPTKDGFLTKFHHLRYLPGALMLESKMTRDRGIPSSYPATGDYLERLTGCRFPVLQHVLNGRVQFALSAMLRENFDPETSVIGLDIKKPLGLIFARVAQNTTLEKYMMSLKFDVDKTTLKEAADFAESSKDGVKDGFQPLFVLAKAISYSPARVSANVTQYLKTHVLEQKKISAAGIVEVVSLMSVLQLVHRLTCFYPEE